MEKQTRLFCYLTTAHNVYYVNSAHDKCEEKDEVNIRNDAVHFLPLDEKNAFYREIISWCLCVPKLLPTSPRFAYYVSRWAVPAKIAAAKAAGTFADTIKDCPFIPPDWPAYVPAALAEYEEFMRPRQRTTGKSAPELSDIKPRRDNVSTKAA